MDLQNFVDYAQTGFIGFLVIVLGMIRIPKIELNLWSLLARSIGRAINGEVLEKVDKLTVDFEAHLKIEEKEKIRQARQRILRFDDEILYRKRHSKEHFEEILEDVDLYEEYCNDNPDYKNNKAVFAINDIKETYNKCLKEHDFLVYNKRREEK